MMVLAKAGAAAIITTIAIVNTKSKRRISATSPYVTRPLLREAANDITLTLYAAPARATIQRGQYTHNHRVLDKLPPSGGWLRFDDLDRERSTSATWLRNSGYRTG